MQQLFKSCTLFNDLSTVHTNLTITNFERERWNNDYEALNFSVSKQRIKSRLAKKTPKKAGYFVALWHKNEFAKNIPFNEADFDDKLVINIIDNQYKGQFIFTKEILIDKGIITTNAHKGKMSFRLYPLWCEDLNKSATNTQQWQLPYFIDMTNGYDAMKINKLYFN
ncbi:MepB protein [Staphylococcus arlettae]|uniref:MepB family protein n=1 Tax=Staphylococcus TaxID=1279 RepID=UPI000D1AE6AF|nr:MULTISPECIES: MepB family protein [Staphylococcus]KAB2480230.1 MepB family protein [Staphylococcus sp. CH99b_3]MCD8889589.1 MepB family protein [Staphylococcus arlettae]PTH36216.1 MepB protein [Staphylococcus arlettae]PTH57455.1 MepB protein [Staphylococcus arlettae]RIM56729.1 MepB protein [Staphylococcus arlettae]